MTPLSVRQQALHQILRGRKILLGVTGGIAAYKVPEWVRELKKLDAQVRCVVTEAALRFVTAETLETLTQQPVVGGSLRPQRLGTQHIEWARWGDVLVVAPATANALAKLAQGLADDELSTEALAFVGPKLIAPAMNPAMWSHPAVARNIAQLRDDGWRVVDPEAGEMACGEEGVGRLPGLDTLTESVAELFFAPKLKRPRRVLISMGPTRSDLDPVRFLTNRSSGKMGAALAWAAAQRGDEVTVVCGALACPHEAVLPRSVRVIHVRSTAEMRDALKHEFPKTDVLVSAAAVLDWEAARYSKTKIKKSQTALSALELKRTPDLLAELGRSKKKHQKILGFAAETLAEDDAERAAELGLIKLRAKGCDAVFVNPVGVERGFETLDNCGWWVTEHGCQPIAPQSKVTLAQKLLRELL